MIPKGVIERPAPTFKYDRGSARSVNKKRCHSMGYHRELKRARDVGYEITAAKRMAREKGLVASKWFDANF